MPKLRTFSTREHQNIGSTHAIRYQRAVLVNCHAERIVASDIARIQVIQPNHAHLKRWFRTQVTSALIFSRQFETSLRTANVYLYQRFQGGASDCFVGTNGEFSVSNLSPDGIQISFVKGFNCGNLACFLHDTQRYLTILLYRVLTEKS